MPTMIAIPVRLSVADDDFDPIYLGMSVFVDGVEQHKVLSYDIEAGRVVRFAEDAKGNLIVRGDEAVTEDVTGRVEVSHPLNGGSRA